MELLRLLRAFVSFFLPPHSDAPEQFQFAWRYKVASTLATTIIAIILICLLSVGRLPYISRGFASVDANSAAHDALSKRIDDQKAATDRISQSLRAMRTDQIDTRLYDARGRQCAAMVTKNDAALRSEGQRLREDLPKYRVLAGEDWRVPDCGEY